MKEFVRRLIREGRERAERRTNPSEVFKRFFGPEHGVDLPTPRPLRIPAGPVRRRGRCVKASVAWILDTNIVSEMMRPHPGPRVERFLDGIAGQGIGLASITVWDILNGIGRIEPGGRREDLLCS